MHGEIHSLNIKNRQICGSGLPKDSVNRAYLSLEGFEGDFNHFRNQRYEKGKHSYEKFLSRAVSIYTHDMINILREEGYPVSEGDLGENLTFKGIPYNLLKSGHKFRLGCEFNEVIIELTESITPCKNLEEELSYFKKLNPVSLLLNRRGWYARVLKTGFVKRGDIVVEVS